MIKCDLSGFNIVTNLEQSQNPSSDSFIPQSVSRQVHSLFHSELSTEWDLELPVLISNTFSFPYGLWVAFALQFVIPGTVTCCTLVTDAITTSLIDNVKPLALLTGWQRIQRIPVIIRSKAQVCDAQLLGLRVRNPLAACVSCRKRYLRWADPSSRGVFPNVCVCMCECHCVIKYKNNPIHLQWNRYESFF
jgi:hypothetical protein